MPSHKTANIVYGVGETDGGDMNLLCDLYYPDEPLGPVPTILKFPGGGWSSASRGGAEIVALAAALNAMGYAFVDATYRIESDAPTVPGGEVAEALSAYDHIDTDNAEACIASMYDMKTLVRWARANSSVYKFDTDNIITCGGSAGAITALTCALSPTSKYVSSHASNNLGESNAIQGCICLWGGAEIAIQEDWISGSSPPVMFWHGEDDTNDYTPYSEIVALWAAMTAAGAPHTAYSIPGYGHAAWAATQNGLTIYQTVVNWVRQHFPNVSNPQHQYTQKAFQ